jgi:hypothetical protein
MVFMCYSQDKHYKNQINRLLINNVKIHLPVDEKIIIPSTQTPKYRQSEAVIQWLDTVEKKINPPSYKQHKGRPN